MTTRFTDDLMEQGLTQKILTLVSQIDLNNEFDKLQRERGLGSEKHRKEVKRGLGVITLPSDCIGENAVRSQGDIFSPYLLVSFLCLWKLGYQLRHKGNYSAVYTVSLCNRDYYQHFCFCVAPFY